MIILVFGLPGSGKSYFSRRLHQVVRAQHISTDKVREELNKKGMYDEQTKKLIYKELINKARVALWQGSDVILDATFHKEGRRKMVLDLAKETGHPLVLIEIKASEDTIRNRLSAKREHSEADFEVSQKIKEEFDPLSDKHLTLWSDSEPVDKMISKAKKYIYEHRTDS